MKTVYIHKYAGILSAYGMALAQVVHEEQEPCALEYKPDEMHKFHQALDRLSSKCSQTLIKQGFQPHQIFHEKFLHMRYRILYRVRTLNQSGEKHIHISLSSEAKITKLHMGIL